MVQTQVFADRKEKVHPQHSEVSHDKNTFPAHHKADEDAGASKNLLHRKLEQARAEHPHVLRNDPSGQSHRWPELHDTEACTTNDDEHWVCTEFSHLAEPGIGIIDVPRIHDLRHILIDPAAGLRPEKQSLTIRKITSSRYPYLGIHLALK